MDYDEVIEETVDKISKRLQEFEFWINKNVLIFGYDELNGYRKLHEDFGRSSNN